MKTFFTVVIGLLMLATFGMLMAGMIGMARGEEDRTRSNRLMRYRVLLQGCRGRVVCPDDGADARVARP